MRGNTRKHVNVLIGHRVTRYQYSIAVSQYAILVQVPRELLPLCCEVLYHTEADTVLYCTMYCTVQL